MNIIFKPIFETVGILVAIFIIVILFSTFGPYIFVPNMAIQIKILFELSPYILMFGLIVMVLKLKKIPISDGLGLNKSHKAKQILTGIIISAITISFIIIPLLCGANKSDVLSFKVRSPIILIYYVIKDIIFIGFGEELVWRGYFFQRVREIAGSGTWAVVVSSIFFGLWHYPNGQNVMQVLMVTGLGLIYGIARLEVKDCSTLATGIAHGLHDAVITILSYIIL